MREDLHNTASRGRSSSNVVVMVRWSLLLLSLSVRGYYDLGSIYYQFEFFERQLCNPKG